VAIARGAGGPRTCRDAAPPKLLELEERTPAADEQRIAQRAAAERRLVVAVEDAERELVIVEKGRTPERLEAALAVQLSSPKKRAKHVGPVDLRQIVLVDGVQRAEPGPHQPESRHGAERQGQQRGRWPSSRRTLSSRDDEAPWVGSSPALTRTTALA